MEVSVFTGLLVLVSCVSVGGYTSALSLRCRCRPLPSLPPASGRHIWQWHLAMAAVSCSHEVFSLGAIVAGQVHGPTHLNSKPPRSCKQMLQLRAGHSLSLISRTWAPRLSPSITYTGSFRRFREKWRSIITRPSAMRSSFLEADLAHFLKLPRL